MPRGEEGLRLVLPVRGPEPAIMLTDGSIVRREVVAGSSRWVRIHGGVTYNAPSWSALLNRNSDTGADFDALKAFAARVAQGGPDAK